MCTRNTCSIFWGLGCYCIPLTTINLKRNGVINIYKITILSIIL
nr:MAG TPA: hypothetical protein [Caudoviricetes sp.]